MILRFRLFFTPAGFAVLAIALVILVRSLLARNAYEILLSCAALFLLLVLGTTGIWKSRKLKSMECGWKPPFPMTANAGGDTQITGLETRIPLFFRLHFIVRGGFFPAGEGYGSGRGFPVSAETSVSRGESSARLSFGFPVSGVFYGEGYCALRDIFGFFFFVCGAAQYRTVNVRSSPCFGKNYHINAQSGAEDRRNKTSSDEEKYYMREYSPGDRFRDINWKSSEKIDALITRISPDNQEKVSRIDVYFRNYAPVNSVGRKRKGGTTTIEALWLLDRAKARLSHFLRSLKEQQSSYIFHVRACGKSWEIEDSDDLDAFLEELAALSFSAPQYETASMHGTGDLYVFSTACDIGLPGFLAACNPRSVSLYLVQPAEKENKKSGKEKKKNDTEVETLRINEFFTNGCIPQTRMIFGSKIKRLKVHAERTEIIYAGTKL